MVRTAMLRVVPRSRRTSFPPPSQPTVDSPRHSSWPPVGGSFLGCDPPAAAVDCPFVMADKKSGRARHSAGLQPTVTLHGLPLPVSLPPCTPSSSFPPRSITTGFLSLSEWHPHLSHTCARPASQTARAASCVVSVLLRFRTHFYRAGACTTTPLAVGRCGTLVVLVRNGGRRHKAFARWLPAVRPALASSLVVFAGNAVAPVRGR